MVSEARMGEEDEESEQLLLQQSITQDRPSFDLEQDSPQQATRVKHGGAGKKTLQTTKTLELKDMIGKDRDLAGNSITAPNGGLLFSH